MAEVQIEEFRKARIRLIEALTTHPEVTAETFYTKRRGRFFSPYLEINLPSLCCLEEEKGTCPLKKEFSWRVLPNISPFVKYLVEKGRRVKKVLPYRGQCGFPLEISTRAIASDGFTNEVFISYLLEYLTETAREEGLDNILFVYTATLCGKKGLLLEEKRGPSLYLSQEPIFRPYQEVGFTIQGEIPVFKEEFILNVLGQLVITLLYLHNWNFVHGELTLENVFFSSQPYTFYPADYTIKIANFSKSSLTYQGERFFNYSSLAESYLNINPFTPRIKNVRGELYFTLDHFTLSQISTEAQHDFIPYYSAFDIYVFLISMFLSPAYFFSLARFPGIVSRIWEVAFSEEDFVLVYRKIYSLQGRVDPNSLKTILEILKEIPLKCNILQLLYDSIFSK